MTREVRTTAHEEQQHTRSHSQPTLHAKKMHVDAMSIASYFRARVLHKSVRSPVNTRKYEHQGRFCNHVRCRLPESQKEHERRTDGLLLFKSPSETVTHTDTKGSTARSRLT